MYTISCNGCLNAALAGDLCVVLVKQGDMIRVYQRTDDQRLKSAAQVDQYIHARYPSEGVTPLNQLIV